MPADDPLSPAELAFRKLLEPVKNKHSGHLELSKEYRGYASLLSRGQLVWKLRSAFLVELAAAKGKRK